MELPSYSRPTKQTKKKKKKEVALFITSPQMQPTSHSTLEKKCSLETSLAVQRLGLDLPMQGVGGSIPGQGVEIPPASWPKRKKSRHKTEAILKQIQ